MDMKCLYVIPGNSPDTAGADYICDGIDDQEEIQAALDVLAAAGGGTVRLKAGRFNISMPVFLKDNLALEGENNTVLFLGNACRSSLAADAVGDSFELSVKEPAGFKPGMEIVIISAEFRFAAAIKDVRGNILILKEGLPVPLPTAGIEVWSSNDILVINGARNVTISGIGINGNSENQVRFIKGDGYLNISGRRVNATDGNSAVFISGGSENVAVESCRIHNVQGSGIFARNAGTGLKFINNVIENIGDKGIVTSDVPGSGFILHNRISGAGKAENIVPLKHPWGWGDCINIHPDSGSRWLVSGNILSYARRSGIRITGATQSIVCNNIIEHCGDYGIVAKVTHDNIFKNNSVSGCGGGVVLAFPEKEMTSGGGVVSGNIISGSRRHGIMGCGAQNCLMTGNILRGNGGCGIIITDRAYEEVEPEAERWPEYPIRRSGIAENIIVSGNVLNGNGIKGICVRNSKNIKVSDNIEETG